MKRDVKIRRAQQEDLEEIHQIECAVEGARAASMRTLSERLAMFPHGFLVAAQCHTVVGFIESCLWNRSSYSTFSSIADFPSHHDPGGRYLYIIFVCVSEAFRRKGVATELVRRELILAENLKLQEVHLVAEHHLLSFYKKLAFRQTSVLPGFLDDVTGYLMKWNPHA